MGEEELEQVEQVESEWDGFEGPGTYEVRDPNYEVKACLVEVVEIGKGKYQAVAGDYLDDFDLAACEWRKL
jgi:hypothetical protein